MGCNLKAWVILTVGLIVVLLIVCLSGCAVTPPRPESIPQTPGQQIINNTIQSTDWLMSILLIGSVLGIFAGLNGVKTGWAGTASCVGGMVLKAALSSTWVFWLCGFLFIVCVVAAVASILWKNKALREIITGIQFVRESVDPEIKENMTEYLASKQGKDTQGLVNQVKADLKLKGVI